jgi:hypothetical protein
MECRDRADKRKQLDRADWIAKDILFKLSEPQPIHHGGCAKNCVNFLTVAECG